MTLLLIICGCSDYIRVNSLHRVHALLCDHGSELQRSRNVVSADKKSDEKKSFGVLKYSVILSRAHKHNIRRLRRTRALSAGVQK